MATVIGWVNIYRSGFFHTPGKPGAYDRHPGDCYATKAAALADIYPESHYIDTVSVQWEEETPPLANLTSEEIAAALEREYVGEVRERVYPA